MQSFQAHVHRLLTSINAKDIHVFTHGLTNVRTQRLTHSWKFSSIHLYWLNLIFYSIYQNDTAYEVLAFSWNLENHFRVSKLLYTQQAAISYVEPDFRYIMDILYPYTQLLVYFY